MGSLCKVDSTAVTRFVVMLVELTNTVFVNSTNITTNIETAVLSKFSSHAEEGKIHILYIYVSHS